VLARDNGGKFSNRRGACNKGQPGLRKDERLQADGGVVVVIDWTPAALRSREQHWNYVGFNLSET
jgi:hypothetical protein